MMWTYTLLLINTITIHFIQKYTNVIHNNNNRPKNLKSKETLLRRSLSYSRNVLYKMYSFSEVNKKCFFFRHI